jgi:hypothetical protein
MASADQLEALLKSHIEGDDSRFYAVAMQWLRMKPGCGPWQAGGRFAHNDRRCKIPLHPSHHR